MRNILAVSLAVIAAICCSTLVAANALDDYVHRPDPHYNVQKLPGSFDFFGKGKGYWYNLTSQKWLNESHSDRSIWWHIMVVVVPHKLEPSFSDTGFIYYTGNCNSEHKLPDGTEEDVFAAGTMGVNVGVITAIVFQIPNCKTIYVNDPEGPGKKREPNEMMALGWWQYIQSNGTLPPEVLTLFPMVKAGVAARRALFEIAPQLNGGKTMSNYVPAGASKRGWTAWLVAAVDKKHVRAMVPIVLEALNLHKLFHEMYRRMGCWTFALSAWKGLDLFTMIDLPVAKGIFELIDPYYYVDRYQSIPTLLIDAVGDEFQYVGDYKNFLPQLSGNRTAPLNYILLNGEHSCATDILSVLDVGTAFLQNVLRAPPAPAPAAMAALPSISYQISPTDGSITATVSEEPLGVAIDWSDSFGGVSAGKQDWRWAAINATPCPFKVFGACARVRPWNSTKSSEYITKVSPTVYKASMSAPPQSATHKGPWKAFSLRFWFKNRYSTLDLDLDPIRVSTGVSILPMKDLPFPECTGESCRAPLC